LGKFGQALGVWDLKIGNIEVELKPTMGDVRKFRKLLTNNSDKSKRDELFEKFSDFMVELIKRHYPDEKEEDIRVDVEVYLNPLFEDAMVTFRWTSAEELEKSKKEALGEIKKLTGDS